MRTLALALLLATASAALAAEPPYVYKRGPSSHMRTNSGMDIRSVVAVAKRYPGDFIWTRRDGREYLIRDAAVLAEAAQAFAALDAMSVRTGAHNRRMRPVERRYDALERRIDLIEEELEDHEEARDSVRRERASQVRELRRELHAVEKELRVLEAEERRLEKESEALEQVAEAKLEEIIRHALRRGAAERVD